MLSAIIERLEMKKKPLTAYFSLIIFLSASFIIGMKVMGKSGYYLAGFYMFGPAIAAIISRLFFYENKFKDAHLGFGRLRDYLRFWGITIGIIVLSYLMFTLFGSVSWDFSGDTFLVQLEEQMTLSGQDINDLPAGLTPKMMLIIFFVGGLTIFNVPLILIGFGEEFGWRGFMFPQLYQIRPWIGFVLGGLLWFAWHIPLFFIMPNTVDFTPWQHMLNAVILALGTICTFVFFAFVYVRSGSIWIASFVHAVFNNGSRSFSYLAKVEDQIMANLALTVTMAIIVGIMYIRKDFKVFPEFFSEEVLDDN
jgi:membrane protease YdiL (CAAX protease family)